MIQQVSAVEHAVVAGVPATLPGSGPPTMTAGLGRPLILTTLENEEAMRLLAGGTTRPRLVVAFAGVGAALVVVGLAMGAIQVLLNVLATIVGALVPIAYAATPTPASGGDPRSSGEGPGLVGEPGLALLVVVAIAIASIVVTTLWIRLTGDRRGGRRRRRRRQGTGRAPALTDADRRRPIPARAATPACSSPSLPYLVLFGATLLVGAGGAGRSGASIAPDSQAAVLYFERILAGQRLEVFVPTNPKPLLSVIFGGLYQLTGDWRTLAWVTLLAHASGVTLTALLATRVGGWIAGTVVGVLLMLNTNLLYDVGFALAVPFALVGWAVAGLAWSARTPRYAIAGLALAWATLARLETVALIGMIILALAWGTFAPARWRIATVPRLAWLVPGLALLAFPVMLIHDQLLTGDPMYWASVAPRYAAQGTARLPSLGEVAGAMIERYWELGGISSSR